MVIPVNFTFHEGLVLARVGAGSFSQAAAGQLVAFEVDEVSEGTGVAWSVLVRGMATLVDNPTETELGWAAEPLVPEPGGMVLTVRQDRITGRRFGVRPAS